MRGTRATLAEWNREPWGILRAWTGGSLVVTVGLLTAVYVIATISRPDATMFSIPGFDLPPTIADIGGILFRNSLVLALHAMACVAGFIAGSALPLAAVNYSGVWRWIHDKAGPLAIGFVVCATTFSLCTQAFVLGGLTSTVASQLSIPPAVLLLSLLPHALPELIALFLPLAAWFIASRLGHWHELLAATFATVAIAVPVLVISAFVEVYVSPVLLRALTG